MTFDGLDEWGAAEAILNPPLHEAWAIAWLCPHVRIGDIPELVREDVRAIRRLVRPGERRKEAGKRLPVPYGARFFDRMYHGDVQQLPVHLQLPPTVTYEPVDGQGSLFAPLDNHPTPR